jgi:hypothetical protein
MLTAVPAIPEKPNTAAMSAMMKKVIAHEIIWSSSFKLSPNESGDSDCLPHRIPQPSAVGASCGRTEPTNAIEIRALHEAHPHMPRFPVAPEGDGAVRADTPPDYATTRIPAPCAAGVITICGLVKPARRARPALRQPAANALFSRTNRYFFMGTLHAIHSRAA